jgi:light-regulated signal transduction histidine kinase (bacteriophytochrome)
MNLMAYTESLEIRYENSLREFIDHSSEHASFEGSSLGRELVLSRQGPEVLAEIHNNCVLRVANTLGPTAAGRLLAGANGLMTYAMSYYSHLEMLEEEQGKLKRALGQLESANVHLLEMNERLKEEIVERTRVEALAERTKSALAERTARLEAACRELESFAYSVSHDLRTPLRHIVGFIGLLGSWRDSLPAESKERHYLEVIDGSAHRMGEQIDHLLEYSRLGRTEILKKPVDLAHLTADTVRGFQNELAGRSVLWDIGPLPVVPGDTVLLRLVMQNLIDNALKFTRNRPEAHIELGGLVSTSGDETIVFVRDNGVGFNHANQDKLFCLFQRLHRQEDFEGTGVGLAIVRRIVERHGGRVWAESKIGEGAVFYFALPTTQRETASSPVSEAR